MTRFIMGNRTNHIRVSVDSAGFPERQGNHTLRIRGTGHFPARSTECAVIPYNTLKPVSGIDHHIQGKTIALIAT